MKKNIFLSFCCLFSLVFFNPVNAQRPGDEAPQLPKGMMPNANQAQQQQNTQNQAEDQKLRAENVLYDEIPDFSKESDYSKQENRIKDAMLIKDEAKRLTVREAAKIIREKNNEVSDQVQSLLLEKFQEGNRVGGGIAERVRTVAQEQLQTQEEIKSRLNQLEERPAWKRFFFGQERGMVVAVDESLKKQTQQLNEWRELLEDPSLTAEERLAIEETLLELQAHQELVEAHVGNVLGEFNLLGFFRRMFRHS
jgi:hypothetical protein